MYLLKKIQVTGSSPRVVSFTPRAPGTICAWKKKNKNFETHPESSGKPYQNNIFLCEVVKIYFVLCLFDFFKYKYVERSQLKNEKK